MKKPIVLLLLIALFLNPSFAFAQTNVVRTIVGNPAQVLTTSKDLKTAYDTCNGSSTINKSGLSDCLASVLSSKYPANIITALKTRQASSLAYQVPLNTPCTQCLGFVALALTLISGATDTLLLNSASDVYGLPSFTVGGITFKKISGQIQPGDIGVKAGGDGHILIVNEPEGNVKFTAIESNGNIDCKITDNRKINRDPYAFFRQQ